MPLTFPSTEGGQQGGMTKRQEARGAGARGARCVRSTDLCCALCLDSFVGGVRGAVRLFAHRQALAQDVLLQDVGARPGRYSMLAWERTLLYPRIKASPGPHTPPASPTARVSPGPGAGSRGESTPRARLHAARAAILPLLSPPPPATQGGCAAAAELLSASERMGMRVRRSCLVPWSRC